MPAEAERVLRHNDNGGYTVPSRSTYPHQWNWESALAALARARDRRGMFPHIAFHTRVPDRLNARLRSLLTTVARPYARYLPGPRWWGRRYAADGRRISGITQPPLAATCARLVFEQHPDERRARALLAPLHAWHRFLLDERDPHGRGEPVLIHPWESGRDNAPEWDGPLWRVLPEVAVLHRRDTDSVDAAERPSDEHYQRFLTLVRHGTAIRWDQSRLAREGEFRVLDPGFSALLARACLDLARLASELGAERIADESHAAGERVAASFRAGAGGLIHAVDLVDDSPLAVTGAGSALAALTPGLEERSIQALAAEVVDGRLASPYGVRSLSRDDPERAQGAAWAPTTSAGPRHSGCGSHAPKRGQPPDRQPRLSAWQSSRGQ